MSGGGWEILLSSRAEKELARLDASLRCRVQDALRALADGEGHVDVRKLAGRDGFRLRVGEWRVLFSHDRDAHAIVVQRILPRGRAYDR